MGQPDKGVPNALMDDEIGAALDAIRDKGAFIWAVFDCCHSGTATRGAEADESERKVESPPDLGIPDADEEPTAQHGAVRAPLTRTVSACPRSI